MTKVFVDDLTGRIARVVADEELAAEPARPGHTVRDWPTGEPLTEESIWPLADAAPSIDEGRVLERAKDEVRARVKLLRDQHKHGGLAIPGLGRIQTDLESRLNISGAVQMADKIGPTFSGTWRMEDNTEVPIDGPIITAIGITVGQHISDCQTRKNVLDAAIGAAATLAELAAIDIESGWPG